MVLLLTVVAWLMISRQERLVFETQRLERLEAAECAALGQAKQSRDEAERARDRLEASPRPSRWPGHRQRTPWPHATSSCVRWRMI